MYRISFILGPGDKYRDKAMRVLLRALTLVDKEYILKNPGAPDPRTLRYEEEAPGLDDWMDASAIVKMRGRVDCEDICAYTAAWLQAKRGIAAWPKIVGENGHSHTMVELPGGKLVDVARMCGAPKHAHSCTNLGKGQQEQRITFITDLFKGGDSQGAPAPLAHKSLMLMLHALFLIDVLWLGNNPQAPLLYESGVRYKVEPPGREDWQDCATNFYRKEADCEDLSTHRAAELWVRYKIAARPTFIWRQRPNGTNLFHIQTTWPDGRVEDPSRTLGMGTHTE